MVLQLATFKVKLHSLTEVTQAQRMSDPSGPLQTFGRRAIRVHLFVQSMWLHVVLTMHGLSLTVSMADARGRSLHIPGSLPRAHAEEDSAHNTCSRYWCTRMKYEMATCRNRDLAGESILYR